MHFSSLWSLLSEIKPSQHCSEMDFFFPLGTVYRIYFFPSLLLAFKEGTWDGGGKQVLPSVTQYGEPYVLFSLGRILIDRLLVVFCCFFFSSVESCPKYQRLIFDWREGKEKLLKQMFVL